MNYFPSKHGALGTGEGKEGLGEKQNSLGGVEK